MIKAVLNNEMRVYSKRNKAISLNTDIHVQCIYSPLFLL